MNWEDNTSYIITYIIKKSTNFRKNDDMCY